MPLDHKVDRFIDQEGKVTQKAPSEDRATTETEQTEDNNDLEVSPDPMMKVQEIEYPKLHLSCPVETLIGTSDVDNLVIYQTMA